MYLPNVYENEAAAMRELRFATRTLARLTGGGRLDAAEQEKLTAVLARLRKLRGDQAADLIGRVGYNQVWV